MRELVLDVNDTLLSRTTRSIPRADVAELCVQTLMHDDAKNRYVTGEGGQGRGAAGKKGALCVWEVNLGGC